MTDPAQHETDLELGDVIEVRERYKVIGFEGPDTLTLNLNGGTVNWWWSDILARDDLDARIVDDDE